MSTPKTALSYAWARHLELSEAPELGLSPGLQAGLDYALQLADNGHERAHDPRRHLRPARLTLAELATHERLPEATVKRRIAHARRYFFGTLSDAAIAKRAQRQQDRKRRTCLHPGCTNLILPPEHGNRRYCPTHATPKTRVRRHRASKVATLPGAAGKKPQPLNLISRTDAVD